MHSPAPPGTGRRVVLFALDVAPGRKQKLPDCAESSWAIGIGIYRGIVEHVLAVPHCGCIHFADGFMCFVPGSRQVPPAVGLLRRLHQSLSSSEIGARMQVGGMSSWRIGTAQRSCVRLAPFTAV